jgi:predicted nucleic acid-binding protein
VFPAFLDTCVLLKPYLCDTLLSIAEAGVYRPLWSPMVITELERNLARRGLDEKRITHRVEQMNGAFPDALVTGYEGLIGEMANDPKDRHVLAAAVRSGAEVLVTENLRDFPPETVRPYDIHVVSQDAFLLDQLDLRPADVIDALRRQVSRYHREPRNAEALLTILGSPGSGCPDFAQSCRQML